MKKYEIMTITKISEGDSGSQRVSNEVKDLVTSNGGKILDSDNMGKRNFAYEINHDTEGYYEVITFECDKKNLPIVKNKLAFINGLVRYLVIAID